MKRKHNVSIQSIHSFPILSLFSNPFPLATCALFGAIFFFLRPLKRECACAAAGVGPKTDDARGAPGGLI
jgi:hypothetical protein